MAKKVVAKKKEVKKVKKATHGKFETVKQVSFNVNGKQFNGVKFVFPLEVVEARKQLLINAYGKDIIK